MSDIVAAVILSFVALTLYVAVAALEFGSWARHRDLRGVRGGLTTSMLASAVLLLFAISLDRAHLIDHQVRVWLGNIIMGQLILAGALLLSVRIRRP